MDVSRKLPRYSALVSTFYMYYRKLRLRGKLKACLSFVLSLNICLMLEDQKTAAKFNMNVTSPAPR